MSDKDELLKELNIEKKPYWVHIEYVEGQEVQIVEVPLSKEQEGVTLTYRFDNHGMSTSLGMFV